MAWQGGGGRASMVRHGNSDRRSLRRSDHRDHRERRHRSSGSDPMVRPSIRAVAAAAVESPRLKEAGPRRSTPERPLTDHGVQTVVRATRGICGHCDQNPTLVAKMVRGSGAAERLRQHATRRRRSLLHLDIGPSARLRHPVARRAPKHGNRAARGLLGGFYSGHCWRTCMVVANNVQTRSNGVDDQINPCARWAEGPCPYRCRHSQRRSPRRELQPKQTVLSSLEFPFLSRPREAHFRASLHR